MSDLDVERKKINHIDEQMVKLFEQRMDAAKNIALYKKQFGLQVFDSEREKEVCKKELNLIQNEEYKPYYLEFIQNLMTVSKKYQNDVIQKIKNTNNGSENKS